MIRALAVLGLVLSATTHARALDEAVHELRWFVHADLLEPMGRTLEFYEQLLAQRSTEADVLLKGFQGPADTPCCTTLTAASVSSFGSAGDGLSIVTRDAELDAISALGAGAYLVRSVFCCGCGSNPNTSILGCANTPGNFQIVSLDAEDAGVLAATIAHERGHSAGLFHVLDNPCQLMAPASGGSCLSIAECNAYRNKAESVGFPCECLADRVGDLPLPDRSTCGDPSGCGLCSGGVCTACESPASVELVSAAGVDAAENAPTDEALTHSAVSGGWRVRGVAAAGAEVSGLAYAARRDVLYGVERVPGGSDLLVTVDPATGSKTAEVGTLAGQSQVVSLAYDPGPETAEGFGDRLYAIQADAEIFGQPIDCGELSPICVSTLIEIDPDDASVRVLGDLDPAKTFSPGGIEGLTYDLRSGELWGSGLLGVVRIDPSCPQQICAADVIEFADQPRLPSSLTYDPSRERLIRMGSVFGETFMDVIDASTQTIDRRISIDPLSMGGVAAVSVPEPCTGLVLFALAIVSALRRARLVSSAPDEGSGPRFRRRHL